MPRLLNLRPRGSHSLALGLIPILLLVVLGGTVWRMYATGYGLRE